MFRILTLMIALALYLPAQALAQHGDGEHGKDHQHAHDHGGEEKPSNQSGEIAKALGQGGSLVEVKVLGMVCDFCATALNKTFGRRDEVAAVNVDLDTKLLSVVLKQGQALDDETIEKLVESAGYKIETIRRAGDENPEGDGE